MKAVLLSLKPEWWEKILAGEKDMEIRKTAPQGGAGEPEPWPVLVLVYVSGTGGVQGKFLCPGYVKTNLLAGLQRRACHTNGRSGRLRRRTGEKRVRLDRGKPGKIR